MNEHEPDEHELDDQIRQIMQAFGAFCQAASDKRFCPYVVSVPVLGCEQARATFITRLSMS